MRLLSLVVLACAILACRCRAKAEPSPGVASVTLAWDKSPSSNVVAYCVYYGGESRTYTNVTAGITGTQITIAGFRRGVTYYFAATAIDSYGLESDYSEELAYTVPAAPLPPSMLRVIEGNRLTILYQSDTPAPGQWVPVASNSAPSGAFTVVMDKPQGFLRIENE